MKKKFIAFLSFLIVSMSFFCVAENSGVGFNAIAAEETNQPAGVEQEFTTTTTTASPTTSTTTQASTTQQTTESTTKSDVDKPTSTTEKPTLIDWGKLTTTKKNEDSTTVPVSEKNEENTTDAVQGTELDGSTTGESTTKKKTTTKRHTTTAPRMTIPVVDNTQVEGTTLSPLDAYFERISDSIEENTYIFGEETTFEYIEVEPERNLSTGAIIALCIGGIALVTCALTGLFVLRNKRADNSEDVEYDDEYEDVEEVDPQADIDNTNVDNTGTFKIVDYNNDDLKK